MPWLVAFGYWLLQIWARTLRFEMEDRADVINTPPNERYIGALWHNRLLLLPFILQRYLPQRRGAALISASRDGAILADLVERFGYEVVRGSSSRKGASAIRQLGEVIASGRDVVITPDGPRGPAYELGQGIIFLAQQSGTEVVPINMEYSSSWRVKSWDRFILAEAVLQSPGDFWSSSSRRAPPSQKRSLSGTAAFAEACWSWSRCDEAISA